MLFMAKKRIHRKPRIDLSKAKTPWATKILRLRERLSLTQEQAAIELGIPLSTLRNWEQGRYEPTTSLARFVEEKLKESKK